jgi:hypothetical protein
MTVINHRKIKKALGFLIQLDMMVSRTRIVISRAPIFNSTHVGSRVMKRHAGTATLCRKCVWYFANDEKIYGVCLA